MSAATLGYQGRVGWLVAGLFLWGCGTQEKPTTGNVPDSPPPVAQAPDPVVEPIRPAEIEPPNSPSPVAETPAAEAAVSSEPPNDVIDLLALLDPEKHAVSGRFQRTEDGIVTAGESVPDEITIPFTPPDEFEIELHTVPVRGNQSIALGFAMQKQPCLLLVDGWPESGFRSGLWCVDRQPILNGPHAVHGRQLADGQPAKIVLQVRKRQIVATADGRTIANWTGEPSGLSMDGYSGRVMPNLSLTTWKASYRVTRLRLRKLTADDPPLVAAKSPADADAFTPGPNTVLMSGQAFVEIANTATIASLHDTVTAETWVRWPEDGREHFILGTMVDDRQHPEQKFGGWVMSMITNQGASRHGARYDKAFTSKPGMQLQSGWHHVVHTRLPDGNIRSYVDGRLAVDIPPTNLDPKAGNVCLGVPIFYPRYARSDAEFAAFRLSSGCLYPEPGFAPPKSLDNTPETLALLDFSQPDVKTLRDLSGHERHGTFVGGVWLIARKPRPKPVAESPASSRRWAILATDAVRAKGLTDLLTARLSQLDGIELVEREAIQRVFDEMKLTANGLVDPAKAVALGRLLSADVLLNIQPIPGVGEQFSIRLVETRTGIRLFELLVTLAGDAGQRTEELVAELTRAKATLDLPNEARRYVGVLGLQSEEPGSAMTALAAALSALVENDLPRVPGVAVLEREQLKALRDEQKLTDVDLELRNSAWLLEGGLRRDDDDRGLKITLRLVPLSQQAGKTWEIATASREPAEARAAVMKKLTEFWNQPAVAAGDGDARQEAAELARRRDWYAVSGRAADAAQLADVVYALAPSRENLRAAIDRHRALANLSYGRTVAEALPRAIRVHELEIELLNGLQPGERVQGMGLMPIFNLPGKPEPPEIQQLRKTCDQLALAKGRLLLAATQRSNGDLVPLLLERLKFATYFAEKPAEVETILRTLLGRFRDLRARESNGEEQFIPTWYRDFLATLFDQVSWSCPVGGWGSNDNRRNWPADQLDGLIKLLRDDPDVNIRVFGLFAQSYQANEAGAQATRELLHLLFHEPIESPLFPLTEKMLNTVGLRLGIEALNKHLGELVDEAELRRDISPFLRWPLYTAFRVSFAREQGVDWASRLLALIDARAYLRRDVWEATYLRAALAKHLEEQKKLPPGSLTARKRLPEGPWSEYEIRPLDFTVAAGETPLSHVTGVHLDRSTKTGEQGPLILVWAANRDSWRVTRWHPLRGRPEFFGPAIRIEKFQADIWAPVGKQIAVSPDAVFVSMSTRGFARVTSERVELFGPDEGAPGTIVTAMAWFNDRLYLGYGPGALCEFDPQTKQFRLLASVRALEVKNPFDGGVVYQVHQLFADERQQCLWLLANYGQHTGPRRGLWKWKPQAASFENVCMEAGNLTWNDDVLLMRHREDWLSINRESGAVQRLKQYAAVDPADFHGTDGGMLLGEHLITPMGKLFTPDGRQFQVKRDWLRKDLLRFEQGFLAYGNRTSSPGLSDVWYVKRGDAVADGGTDDNSESRPLPREVIKPRRIMDVVPSRYALRFTGKQFVELADTAKLAAWKPTVAVEMWVRWRKRTPVNCLLGTYAEGGRNPDFPQNDLGWYLSVQRYPMGDAIMFAGNKSAAGGAGGIAWTIPDPHLDWHHLMWAVDARGTSMGYLDGKNIGNVGTSGEDPGKANLCLGTPLFTFRDKQSHIDIRALRISSQAPIDLATTREFKPDGFDFRRGPHTQVLLDFSHPHGDRIPDVTGNGHDGEIEGPEWVKIE